MSYSQIQSATVSACTFYVVICMFVKEILAILSTINVNSTNYIHIIFQAVEIVIFIFLCCSAHTLYKH